MLKYMISDHFRFSNYYANIHTEMKSYKLPTSNSTERSTFPLNEMNNKIR